MPALYAFKSSATVEHEMPVDGYLSHHHQHINIFQSMPSATSIFGNWPSAVEHPLFYVGIYAAIGFSIALSKVLSVTVQFTGALRASRILFK